MKILLSLLAIVMLTKECDKNTVASENINATSVENSQQENKMQNEELTISYERMTRGFYEKIWITKNTVSVTNDRNLTDVKTATIDNESWNKLLSMLGDVDVNTLSQLEAPTKDHQFDGAAMATLEIDKNKEIYKTNIFDHGNPPQSIKAIVDKVLSMGKMAQKE